MPNYFVKFVKKILLRSHATELDAVIAGEAIMTVQLLIAHTHVCTGHSVAQLDAAHAAFETVQVIE